MDFDLWFRDFYFFLEHFLMQVDPELCDHLQECYIQSQIYGMRWSRLMFSREFPISHDFSLKIWDFLFATRFELEPVHTRPKVSADISAATSSDSSDMSPMRESPPAAGDILSELPSAQASMSSATKALRERYGDYSKLMGVLGDFMLAMLLHVSRFKLFAYIFIYFIFMLSAVHVNFMKSPQNSTTFQKNFRIFLKFS